MKSEQGKAVSRTPYFWKPGSCLTYFYRTVLPVELLKWEMWRLFFLWQKWRVFCNHFDGAVADWNFASLLRLDCSGDVSEENTTIGMIDISTYVHEMLNTIKEIKYSFWNFVFWKLQYESNVLSKYYISMNFLCSSTDTVSSHWDCTKQTRLQFWIERKIRKIKNDLAACHSMFLF